MVAKKFFLIVAFLSISVIAAGYGFNPPWFARVFLGVTALDSNLAHILRAIMGLYFGFGLFWFMSAFRERQNAALLTIIFFCAGLLAGRIISILVEGAPAALLQIYTAIEAVLIPITYWVYRPPIEAQHL
jgi:hypothetical protein